MEPVCANVDMKLKLAYNTMNVSSGKPCVKINFAATVPHLKSTGIKSSHLRILLSCLHEDRTAITVEAHWHHSFK